MSWEDQGRQQHGEFGHGTAPPKIKNNSAGGGLFDEAEVEKRAKAVSYSVLGALPRKLRGQAEAQFGPSGARHTSETRSRMVDLMTAWSGASDLDPESFASRFFDRPVTDPFVIHLRAVALGLDAAKTHSEMADISDNLAAAMQIIGIDRWPRFLDVAEKRASQPTTVHAAKSAPANTPKAAKPHGAAAKEKPTNQLLRNENVANLAKLIYTEAQGTSAGAMAAVGWTVLNRMQRNGSISVSANWGGYAHGQVPSGKEGVLTTTIARQILSGDIKDPTNGATHFYTPKSMPKEGDKTDNRDVGGDLELVPGVERDKKPIRNYRPSWTLTFDPRFAPDVPDSMFKFYRQPGSGHVH